MKIAVKFIPIKFWLFVITICFAFTANAQNNNGYNEDDYDGEYDYETDNPYNNFNENVQRSKRPKYGNARNEEELYNGQYQQYLRNTDLPNENWLSRLRIFETKSPKENYNTTEEELITPLDKPKVRYRPDYSTGKSEGIKPDEGLDNQYGADSEFKEIDPEEGNNPGTPPPPPDEPDVPVDTAIPFLITSGILLAAIVLHKKQIASHKKLAKV